MSTPNIIKEAVKDNITHEQTLPDGSLYIKTHDGFGIIIKHTDQAGAEAMAQPQTDMIIQLFDKLLRAHHTLIQSIGDRDKDTL